MNDTENRLFQIQQEILALEKASEGKDRLTQVEIGMVAISKGIELIHLVFEKQDKILNHLIDVTSAHESILNSVH